MAHTELLLMEDDDNRNSRQITIGDSNNPQKVVLTAAALEALAAENKSLQLNLSVNVGSSSISGSHSSSLHCYPNRIKGGSRTASVQPPSSSDSDSPLVLTTAEQLRRQQVEDHFVAIQERGWNKVYHRSGSSSADYDRKRWSKQREYFTQVPEEESLESSVEFEIYAPRDRHRRATNHHEAKASTMSLEVQELIAASVSIPSTTRSRVMPRPRRVRKLKKPPQSRPPLPFLHISPEASSSSSSAPFKVQEKIIPEKESPLVMIPQPTIPDSPSARQKKPLEKEEESKEEEKLEATPRTRKSVALTLGELAVDGHIVRLDSIRTICLGKDMMSLEDRRKPSYRSANNSSIVTFVTHDNKAYSLKEEAPGQRTRLVRTILANIEEECSKSTSNVDWEQRIRLQPSKTLFLHIKASRKEQLSGLLSSRTTSSSPQDLADRGMLEINTPTSSNLDQSESSSPATSEAISEKKQAQEDQDRLELVKVKITKQALLFGELKIPYEDITAICLGKKMISDSDKQLLRFKQGSNSQFVSFVTSSDSHTLKDKEHANGVKGGARLAMVEQVLLRIKHKTRKKVPTVKELKEAILRNPEKNIILRF